MNMLKFIQELFGKKVAKYVSILILGGSLVYALPMYIVTKETLQKELQEMQVKQERVDIGFQIQLNEVTMRTLSDQIFQLKKLKIKKMADDLDLEQLEEYKKQFDTLRTETDSLKKQLYQSNERIKK